MTKEEIMRRLAVAGEKYLSKHGSYPPIPASVPKNEEQEPGNEPG